MDGPEPPPPTRRQWVYEQVNGEMDSLLEYGIMYLIFASSFLFIIGTLQVGVAADGQKHLPCQPTDTCKTFYDVYREPLEVFETLAVAVFTVEYVARLWTILEDPIYAARGPVWGRISYMLTFFAMIDLVVILPWWLDTLGVWAAGRVEMLRMVRLLRMLKTEKYLGTMELFSAVMKENEALMIAWLLCWTNIVVHFHCALHDGVRLRIGIRALF